MGRIIAISDIHGCFNSFKKLIKGKVQLTKDDQLFLLGDYIDRGPKSMEVIDWILKKQKKGFIIKCLMGNHEQVMLNSLSNEKDRRNWLSFGGDATMKSFGVNKLEDIPVKYWKFFEKLKYYVKTENYLFVHAGLNLRVRFPLRDTESLLWIRRWNNNPKYKGKQIVVHGHTPISKDEIKKAFSQVNEVKVLNIDAGCYTKYFDRGMGALCAVDFTNRKLFFQKNIDVMEWV